MKARRKVAKPGRDRKCRNCASVVPKARWETGRDYCTDAACIKECAPKHTYLGVAVAKSIPQILPVQAVDPTVARSGHRRP